MGKEFSNISQNVPRVSTKFRKISTAIPHPDSIPVLERLRKYEPQSMRGQPPIVWDRAEGIFVFDKYGNQWLDWSSGVLVTNAGHAAPEVCEAIRKQVDGRLLHNYCFPSEERADLVQTLVEAAPEGLQKAFLLTTGSEATECAIKLARAHGIKVGGNKKIGIVGFERGFHGRTLGSQQAGGMAGQKSWIVNLDPAIINAPFPDGFWERNTTFDTFLKTVANAGMESDQIAGVMMETYQGVGPDFAPVPYVRELAAWCAQHRVVLIFDEVQAGFGRTGKFWGFEHYGVTPDVICCGKGISSSLPISAVLGREEVMDQFGPGAMTSTHTGNPVCCVAALASLRKIVNEDLAGNAARLEPVLARGIQKIQERHKDVIGHVSARGLVGGLQAVKPGVLPPQPNHDLAHRVIEKCFQKGLLLFAPVGAWGQTIKIAPPLIITREALEEGLTVLSEAVDEAVLEMNESALATA